MIRQSSIQKLRNNQPIRITTPASNPVTNKVGFEILKRYAQKEGFVLESENVAFVETDFYHLKNLQEGDFNGAWLCFYNFEVIEAEHIGFGHLFIDQYKPPYANFSALELMTTEAIFESKKDPIEKFIAVTNEMIRYLGKNTEFGKIVYYDYIKNEKDTLMDKIIEDTITSFNYLKRDSNRWKSLCEFLKELEVVDLSDDDYDKIWKL